jgi:hypothetical protein
MNYCLYETFRWIERMNTTHWVMVFLVAVAIGLWAMRGFGSRTSY